MDGEGKANLSGLRGSSVFATKVEIKFMLVLFVYYLVVLQCIFRCLTFSKRKYMFNIL